MAQTPASGAPQARAGDSLRNGTLIGAGVGFAAGFLGLAAFNAKETASGPIWDGEAIGYYTSAGLLGAAIGAGLGAIIDAVKRDEHSPVAKKRLTIGAVARQTSAGDRCVSEVVAASVMTYRR